MPLQNRLLSLLTHEAAARLEPLLEPVDLRLFDRLVEPFQPITHVHFVETGILSVISDPDGKDRIEVGLIGWEGMSGSTVDCSGSQIPYRVLVQHEGRALRMATDRFLESVESDPALGQIVRRFGYLLAIQAAETARAGARFSVEMRLARWLLMAHDRLIGDEVHFTHDILATMLGVRRPGVTVATHILEGEHLIRATRGKVRILDRAGLQRYARDSYGVPEDEYRRLLGLDPVRP